MSDRHHLLIVEDDANLARMLVEFFAAQGFGVRAVEWGLEAVYACWETPPDLALLDIYLPDISGYDVARRLHAHRRTRDIPLIFLTSRRRREDRLQGLGLGAVDYIAKPFDLQELLLRVRNALRRHKNPLSQLFNPITALPEGALVDEQLNVLLSQPDWVALIVRLRNLNLFREAYGFVAADDALKAISLRLHEAADPRDAHIDFLGQLGTAEFVVVTRAPYAASVRRALAAKLERPVDFFYPLEDRPEVHDPARHLTLDVTVVGVADVSPTVTTAALRDLLLGAAHA